MSKITTPEEAGLQVGDWVEMRGQARVTSRTDDEITFTIRISDLEEAWVNVAGRTQTGNLPLLVFTPKMPAPSHQRT